MLKDKIYINDRQAFIEWKRKYTNSGGIFYANCWDEKEPNSYPCILLEIDEYDYNSKLSDYDYNIYYDFVYLTDFISDYGK
jgi:hypothetical protein